MHDMPGTRARPKADARIFVSWSEQWDFARYIDAYMRSRRLDATDAEADMWDLTALAPGGDGLSAYTPSVRHLAQPVLDYGRPVLLLNGDSHLYESDRPLADPSSPTGVVHGTPAVPNLTRITVQGSTNAPAEWLRVTVDPSRNAPFTWANVPYCRHPLAGCN